MFSPDQFMCPVHCLGSLTLYPVDPDKRCLAFTTCLARYSHHHTDFFATSKDDTMLHPRTAQSAPVACVGNTRRQLLAWNSLSEMRVPRAATPMLQ